MAPMYDKRFQGERARDDLRYAAGEASALNLVAPPVRGDYAPRMAAARDYAMRGARDQTVLHHQIRQGYLKDAAADERDRQNDIQYWADYAMKQRNATSALDLHTRGADRQDRALDIRDRESGDQMDFRREEMGVRGDQFDQQMDQRREETGLAGRRFDDQMAFRREDLAERREYHQGASRRGQNQDKVPMGVMDRMARDAGFDTTDWIDDKGYTSSDAQGFYDHVQDFVDQGVPREESVSRAAAAMRLQRPEQRLQGSAHQNVVNAAKGVTQAARGVPPGHFQNSPPPRVANAKWSSSGWVYNAGTKQKPVWKRVPGGMAPGGYG